MFKWPEGQQEAALTSLHLFIWQLWRFHDARAPDAVLSLLVFLSLSFLSFFSIFFSSFLFSYSAAGICWTAFFFIS